MKTFLNQLDWRGIFDCKLIRKRLKSPEYEMWK